MSAKLSAQLNRRAGPTSCRAPRPPRSAPATPSAGSAMAEDHAERQHPRAHEVPNHPFACCCCGRAPDAIERVLQLAEHRGRADESSTMPMTVASDAAFRLARARNQAFDRVAPHRRRSGPEICLKISPRAASSPKKKPATRDHDEQQRRDREQRVVRQRRAHARRIVGAPRADRPHRQPPFVAQIHRLRSCGVLGGAAMRRLEGLP